MKAHPLAKGVTPFFNGCQVIGNDTGAPSRARMELLKRSMKMKPGGHGAAPPIRESAGRRRPAARSKV